MVELVARGTVILHWAVHILETEEAMAVILISGAAAPAQPDTPEKEAMVLDMVLAQKMAMLAVVVVEVLVDMEMA
jgi:hypothetical protein